MILQKKENDWNTLFPIRQQLHCNQFLNPKMTLKMRSKRHSRHSQGTMLGEQNSYNLLLAWFQLTY
jgi:hypothetical protein